MTTKYNTKLLLNVEEGNDHKSKILTLLKNARSFDCMVAFAKASVWKDIKPALVKALARGMRARFAIGLDFYHTDPELLNDLYKIASKPGSLLELYLSDAAETFHPKMYAFSYPDGCTVLVGSANFTQGGLAGNYEASVLINDDDGEMRSAVVSHFDELIEEEILVPATEENIGEYAYEHEIYKNAFLLAKRRAKQTIAQRGNSFYALSDFLTMMKEGSPKSRFDDDMAIRRETLKIARARLDTMANWQGEPAVDFAARYSDLIAAFHSGGISRSKSFVSAHPVEFTKAIAEIAAGFDLEPGEAFAILHKHFVGIKGAGINLLTEILHSLDNKRFAVMNQNSVAGLQIAGYHEFPERPKKGDVDSETYQLYCDSARKVREKLGLSDFTELDALFNFVYWHDDRVTSDENDEM